MTDPNDVSASPAARLAAAEAHWRTRLAALDAELKRTHALRVALAEEDIAWQALQLARLEVYGGPLPARLAAGSTLPQRIQGAY
jgi:hypothetical protein